MAEDAADKTFEEADELPRQKEIRASRREGERQGSPWNEAGATAERMPQSAAGARSLTPSGETVLHSDHGKAQRI
jgi:hypothetical protein